MFYFNKQLINSAKKADQKHGKKHTLICFPFFLSKNKQVLPISMGGFLIKKSLPTNSIVVKQLLKQLNLEKKYLFVICLVLMAATFMPLNLEPAIKETKINNKQLVLMWQSLRKIQKGVYRLIHSFGIYVDHQQIREEQTWKQRESK